MVSSLEEHTHTNGQARNEQILLVAGEMQHQKRSRRYCLRANKQRAQFLTSSQKGLPHCAQINLEEYGEIAQHSAARSPGKRKS